LALRKRRTRSGPDDSTAAADIAPAGYLPGSAARPGHPPAGSRHPGRTGYWPVS